MCGFHGVFTKYSQDNEVDYNFASLNHRGPDENRKLKIDSLYLEFFRLKILGGSFGSQPMYSENKEWLIAFNGEIYNYKELACSMQREDLIKNGDTRVLVEFISKYRFDKFNEVNGMFSIALYNTISKKIYFIRDRFGIKPLYYKIINKKIYFGSEIKSFPFKEISMNKIEKFTKSGKYPESFSTFYEDIVEFKPGIITSFNGNEIEEHTFYSLSKNISKTSLNNLEEYEHIIEDAIKIRLRSDVPISLHFSGGVDSTALLIKTRELVGKNFPLGVFNVTYDGFGHLDHDYAKKICDLLNVELTVVKLSPEEVPTLAEELQFYQDEPYGGIPAISMYKMNLEEIKKGYVVSLEGQGGDEALGGYLSHTILALKDIYEQNNKNGLLKNILSQNRLKINNSLKLANKFIDSGFSAHTDLTDLKKLKSRKVTKNKNWLLTIQLHDILENKIPRTMRFHDRISAACSRELRFPFLDYRVLEYGLGFKNEVRYRNGLSKYPLKNIIYRLLPEDLFNAQKRSDSSPQTRWFYNELNYWCHENINQLKEKNIISHKYIEDTIDEFKSKSLNNTFKIWQLINLNLMSEIKN